jgi:hypothetical protein
VSKAARSPGLSWLGQWFNIGAHFVGDDDGNEVFPRPGGPEEAVIERFPLPSRLDENREFSLMPV